MINDYEIIRDYCNEKVVHKGSKIYCLKCNDTNIIIENGNGENIYVLFIMVEYIIGDFYMAHGYQFMELELF